MGKWGNSTAAGQQWETQGKYKVLMKSKIDAKVNAKVKTNGDICSLSDV